MFLVAGVAGIFLFGPRKLPKTHLNLAVRPLPLLGELPWFFLKVGSLIFGGGLVIVPFTQNEVVNRLGWLTQREFLDGLAGALVATASIFLPSFCLILLAAYARRWQDSANWRAALGTINPAAVGAVLGSFWSLARAPLGNWFGLAWFAVALAAMQWLKISFLRMLGVGAVVGLLLWLSR